MRAMPCWGAPKRMGMEIVSEIGKASSCLYYISISEWGMNSIFSWVLSSKVDGGKKDWKTHTSTVCTRDH